MRKMFLNKKIIEVDGLSINDKINFRTLVSALNIQRIRKIFKEAFLEDDRVISSFSIQKKEEIKVDGLDPSSLMFIKEEDSVFFYGLRIEEIKFFHRGDFVEYIDEIPNISISERYWYQNDISYYGSNDPYYDMALVNGKFWTFVPNLQMIYEIAHMSKEIEEMIEFIYPEVKNPQA